MKSKADWNPDDFHPGDPVDCEWEGRWHKATVCCNRGPLIDVSWSDGSFTPSIPRARVRILPQSIKVGDVVSVRQGRKGPKVLHKKPYRIGMVTQVTRYGCDVRWLDGVTAANVKQSQMRKIPAGAIDPDHHRLHGRLDIMCLEARDLPNGDGFACFAHAGDPFCEMSSSRGTVIARTPVKDDTHHPKWGFVYNDVMVPDSSAIHLAIKDSDVGANQLLCETVLCCHNGLSIVAEGGTFAGWLQLRDRAARKAGEVFVAIKLVPPEFEMLPHEVAGARFPMHQYHRVTLYQSAHVGSWANRLAGLPNGYVRSNCWEDVATRLMQARHFIYITGWSVNPDTRILRERAISIPGYGELGTDRTLGDMLIEKANEGVAVCVLIWKEKTSASGEGLAGTMSGQTIKYFQNTNVQCAGVYRDAKKTRTSKMLEDWLITHHQKAVVCDVQTSDTQRRGLAAFIGGLDLTTGRWDTPGKEIFRTLQNHHAGDFYQTMVATDEGTGPRQPWQDIHSQIEGPAAYDIAQNFENRWRTQVRRLQSSLFGVEGSPRLLGRHQDMPCSDDNQWNVQLYRSITGNSDQTTRGVEADCHKAWLEAIVNARRYIYIENQYFMGMSDEWKEGKSVGTATNRIAQEITNRIITAIRRGERFAVYIIVPLFPEGDPTSMVMQEIVYWQRQTVDAMYRKIAKALKSTGSSAVPTDYLNFYTLLQKKPKDRPRISAKDKGRKRDVLINARIPIYVHSKLIIVDDRLFIVGSCNVNDRSMAGDRDTEIAVGMYQPHHGEHGDVHAFRLSLWSEHMNLSRDRGLPKCVYRPETIECVRWVNALGLRSWRAHVGDHNEPQPCHLVKYPYVVKQDGGVAAMQDEIPDAKGAQILGKESMVVPDFLTS
eukprot:TRINITY_DN6044_c0_g1_i1.p1 TRINITY_DN6044_c0_g1~~TRINITY_DN6044_c0_g1_i1.p1  ORF type:complete len:883 (+),score=219.95 TRINITY_DN6044_c0_g1_i1:1-2649(+)